MIIRIKKMDVLGCLILLFIVLWSGSPYQTIYPLIDNLQVPAAFIFLFFSLAKFRRDRSLSFYTASVLILLLMIFLTWAVYLFEVPIVYLKEACFVFLAFSLTQLFDFRKVISVYVKIMTWVAAVSLVGYVLANYTQILHSLPTAVNGNGVKYNIGFLFNFLTEYPRRNCGIFWEPGIYASFLALAIVFELCFNQQRRSVPRLILFFITILTTNSTAGLVLWLLCIMLWIIPTVRTGKATLGSMAGYGMLVVLILLVLNLEAIVSFLLTKWDNPYLEKLLLENVTSNARYLSLVHNLQIFLEYPLFGAGLTGVARRMAHVADISTSTYVMSKYGILGIFYTVCWFVGVFRQKHLNNYCRILLISILMLIVNKETHSMILFSWMLMFFLLKEDGLAYAAESPDELRG